MSFSTRTIGLAAGVAILAAACGSAATSSSPGASSTFPNVSPSAGVGGASATPELSTGTGTTGDLGGSTGIGGTGTGGTGMAGDQLVGTIPTTVGTTTLTVRTATPADLPMFDGASGAGVLSALGTTLGVDTSRMTAALGTNADGTLTIGALDIPGTDVDRLNSALPGAFSTLGASGIGSSSDVAGRSVTSFSAGGATVYVWPTGSTVYLIKSTDKALADLAVAALPGGY